MYLSDKCPTEGMAAENLDEPAFCWGKKKGVGLKDKGVQFYESFTYDGVEYTLYDSVYMHNEENKDLPHIGMLVKIWETARNSKRIKVQWFFRASEISHWLRKHNLGASENELFLATGDGVGLENINPVEAIAGKCSVICISRDSRNPQSSAEHLQMADYVFYRTFDVGKFVISEKMDDKVGGPEVKYVFKQCKIEMNPGPKILPKPNEKLNGITVLLEEAVHLSGKDGSSGGCGREKAEDTTAVDSVKVRKNINNREDLVDVATKIDEDHSSLDGGPSFKVPRVEGSDQWPRVKKINPLDKGPKISTKGLSLAPTNEDSRGGKRGPVKDSREKLLVKDGSFGGSGGEKAEDASAVDPVNVMKNSNIRKDQVEWATKFDEDLSSLDGGPSKKPRVEGSVHLPKVAKKIPLDKGHSIRIKGLTLAPNEEDPMGRISGPVVGSSNDKLSGKYGLSGRDGSFGVWGKIKVEDASAVETVKAGKNSNLRKNQVEVGTKFDEDPWSLDGGPSKKSKVEGTVQWPKGDKKIFLDKGPSIDGLAPTKEEPVGRKSGLGGGSLKGKLFVGKIYDVTQRPSNEKGKWFKSNPWDADSMRCAQDERRVILVENLDPEYTSGEVEDILWSAFQVSCTAKVIQHTTFSSPLYGQALAILKTRDAAERVVGKLNEGCLIISGKRALTASIVILPELNSNRKKCNFVGHLSFNKIKLQREQKDARSTSHHSQPNTIEYELALDWCLLQSRHELAWKRLQKLQAAEFSKCATNFKPNARGSI